MDSEDRKLVLWWAVLVGLTVLSFEGSMQWLGTSHTGFAVVIVIALIKIRMVILHFMEVAAAPLVLRAPLEAWIVLLGIALFVTWEGYLG